MPDSHDSPDSPRPVSHAGADRLDPRVVRTLGAIGDAVRELLVEEGWDAITHQRVAERSGYARNTIYRHFPDRIDLLSHGGKFDDAVHHADLTGDVRDDLVAELCCFRRELFDGVVGTIIGAIVERADRDPEVIPVRDGLVASGARITFELVAEARAADRLRVDLPDDDVVAALCGPLLYARLCQGRAPSDASIEAMVDAVVT